MLCYADYQILAPIMNWQPFVLYVINCNKSVSNKHYLTYEERLRFNGSYLHASLHTVFKFSIVNPNPRLQLVNRRI